MKRPLWSILTAAIAAVLPGMTGPTTSVDVVPAPVAETAKPAPEAIQVRRPEIRHDQRQLDERDENPAPELAVATIGEPPIRFVAVESVSAPPAAPDVAPKARRSLGRPRVRAPDHRTV